VKEVRRSVAGPQRQRHLVVEAERAEVAGFELRHHRPRLARLEAPAERTQCDTRRSSHSVR
jgi:hypothetical protein